MGLGPHTRCDPQHHLGREAVLGMQADQAVQLVERVDDDPADPISTRHTQLGLGLVVAVENQPISRDTCDDRCMQLATAGNVEMQPLLVDQSGHRHAEERLTGVRHTLTERFHSFATPGPQMRLVVNEERCAVFRGEFRNITTTNHEVAAR